MSDGTCLGCVKKYILQNGICLSLASINPNCKTFNNTQCINCKANFYIGINTICTAVNHQCISYKMSDGTCLACVAGLSPLGNICVWFFTHINILTYFLKFTTNIS
jgi:hypothetical protein